MSAWFYDLDSIDESFFRLQNPIHSYVKYLKDRRKSGHALTHPHGIVNMDIVHKEKKVNLL